ncbi:hypothetical protein CONLIGDRAFT_707528 [Coniochaeta ligniaria NRRL 30616]|uniref:C2H2-type domain-containing protein n=1 Tax=Coniochaeta ligniaria NRRL 30616 TaxID=1408157 RepID=A0A1J7IHH4_9PEZI|nr:hypothetical protein CONLIGDRAFT_707528 [Coniochaeta ligniaria NRRL 30616]
MEEDSQSSVRTGTPAQPDDKVNCPACNKQFTKRGLSKHINSKHPSHADNPSDGEEACAGPVSEAPGTDDPCTCPVCERIYSCRKSLYHHIRESHSDILDDDETHEEMLTKAGVVMNKTGKVKCQLCENRLLPKNLKRHVQQKHQGIYEPGLTVEEMFAKATPFPDLDDGGADEEGEDEGGEDEGQDDGQDDGGEYRDGIERDLAEGTLIETERHGWRCFRAVTLEVEDFVPQVPRSFEDAVRQRLGRN